jgi:hypothetical protein
VEPHEVPCAHWHWNRSSSVAVTHRERRFQNGLWVRQAIKVTSTRHAPVFKMTPRPFALAASKSRPPSKNLLEIEDFLLIVQNGPGFAVPSYGFVPSGNGRFPHSSPQSQPTPVLEQLRDRRHARWSSRNGTWLPGRGGVGRKANEANGANHSWSGLASSLSKQLVDQRKL